MCPIGRSRQCRTLANRSLGRRQSHLLRCSRGGMDGVRQFHTRQETLCRCKSTFRDGRDSIYRLDGRGDRDLSSRRLEIRRLRMMNQFESSGTWFLDDDLSNSVPGTLHYDSEGLNLKLLGSFRESWSTGVERYPTIRGV